MNSAYLSIFASRLAPSILLVYFVLIAAELLIDQWSRRKLYGLNDTIENLSMFVLNRMLGGITGLLMLGVLESLPHLSSWHLPEVPQFLLTAFVVDFLFFLQHLAFHKFPLLSAFHDVHHSSGYYNLTTTLRANLLLPLINPLFYAPAVLLGCDPLAVVLNFALIQVYQFFLHTRLVPSLGIFEGWINTPSAHRVHHGDQPHQISKNLGGVLVVWDRLFGTYSVEPAELTFGIAGRPPKSFIEEQLTPLGVCAAILRDAVVPPRTRTRL